MYKLGRSHTGALPHSSGHSGCSACWAAAEPEAASLPPAAAPAPAAAAAGSSAAAAPVSPPSPASGACTCARQTGQIGLLCSQVSTHAAWKMWPQPGSGLWGGGQARVGRVEQGSAYPCMYDQDGPLCLGWQQQYVESQPSGLDPACGPVAAGRHRMRWIICNDFIDRREQQQDPVLPA